MDRIEKAREMFRELEARGAGYASEVARRNFFVEDSLRAIQN